VGHSRQKRTRCLPWMWHESPPWNYLVRQDREAAKMCLNQHGLRPRSMDIARQRHRLELNQGQREVMLRVPSHHRLPKSSRGVTGHPKSIWGPNDDYCSGINDIDVAGTRSLMILNASILICFAMLSGWHRLRNPRNWNIASHMCH